MIKSSLAIILCVLLVLPAAAERAPAPGPSDARVRTVVYNPRDVVHVLGHYGYQTLIRFSDGEHIENISIGDALAWQVVPNARGNLLFVKPVEENAATNLTVVTGQPSSTATDGIEQRVYVFALSANEAAPNDAGALTWTVQFQYPDDDLFLLHQAPPTSTSNTNATIAAAPGNDPAEWNFNYSFAGSIAQVPVKVFDNGVFTYFEFDDQTDVPAIFLVDSERNESLVNGVRQGKYLVVHRIGRQFTLRNGDTVTCLFNEAYPATPTLDQGSPVPREARSDSSAATERSAS